MMESTAFFNAKAEAFGVTLFLDINPKNDTIKEFFFDGKNRSFYEVELEELKTMVLEKTLTHAHLITRSSLSHETKLPNGQLGLAPLGLWLLKKALANYEGEDAYYSPQKDMVCLCFSVSKRDIEKKVLSNKDFELKTLIAETMASSACGSCRVLIGTIIEETRNTHGLIKGLDHSKSRYDQDGKWIKVAGLYPGELIIKLEELKNKWMQREKIEGQFVMEWVDVEGLHLTLKINSTNETTIAGLLSALGDYLKSELGVLFFLKKSV